jgi:hypothetical protein
MLRATHDLAGSLVFLNGCAGPGIPRAVALAFADAGAYLVGWDINEQGGKSLLQEVSACGGRMEFHRADAIKALQKQAGHTETLRAA